MISFGLMRISLYNLQGANSTVLKHDYTQNEDVASWPTDHPHLEERSHTWMNLHMKKKKKKKIK